MDVSRNDMNVSVSDVARYDAFCMAVRVSKSNVISSISSNVSSTVVVASEI